MASSANIVVLMGNLTRNPELRYTPGGKAVTTLNLAVNRGYKDRETGKFVEQTDFIPVSVWGRMAENCEKYLSKGRPVYIEGRISQRSWEDPSGEKRSRLEVVARNVQFLSGGSSPGSRASDHPADEDVSRDDDFSEDIEDDGADAAEDDEEIPF